MADDFEEFDDSGVIGVCDKFGNNDNVCRDFEPLGFSDFGLVGTFGFGLVDDFAMTTI